MLHIDSGHDILVLDLGRQEKPLPEDVEPEVAADRAHELVAAGLGREQGDLGREPEREALALQCDERCLAAEPGVAAGR